MICNHTKRVSWSYQKFIIQLALINLHSGDYSQDFQYYLFAANKDRRVGSCNFLNNLSNEVCVPSKTEDLNLSALIMIRKWIRNFSKRHHENVNVNLMEENVIQVKSGIMINSAASAKSIIYVKEIIFGKLLNVVVKMVNT